MTGGASVLLAALVGRTDPLGASIWIILVLTSLYLARRLQSGYRTGSRRTDRPFRWRAEYTATLSVLSAGFGSGAFFLTAAAPATDLVRVQIIAGICVALLLAGLMHAAHARAAAAMAAPGLGFAAVATLVRLDCPLFSAALITVSAALLYALLAFSQRTMKTIHDEFPRSTVMRGSVEKTKRNKVRREDADPEYASASR